MTTPPWGEQPDQTGQPDHQGQQGPAQPYQQPYQQYGAPGGYGQPQSPYGAPGYPSPYGAPATTNGMAIASLVTSVVGLVACCGLPGVVGAILGHMARKQIKERNEQGDGLALAGIIVGWISFAIFIAVVAFYIVVFAVAASTDTATY